MKLLLISAVAAVMGVGFIPRASAQTPRKSSGENEDAVQVTAVRLATVHIPRTTKADGQVLHAGTYQVRSTGEAAKPVPGETPNQEQWVEFLQAGKVKGKAVATVVPRDQIRDVEKEALPADGHARVQLLKGNDYVRVWINKGGTSYLIHLPTA